MYLLMKVMRVVVIEMLFGIVFWIVWLERASRRGVRGKMENFGTRMGRGKDPLWLI